MVENKKGEIGMRSIFAFLILAVMFILMVGLYDLFQVEVYEPTSSLIKNMTLELNNDTETNIYYQKQVENDERTIGLNFPFNLLFIFITFVAFVFSIYDAITRKKIPIFNLFVETVGGLIVGTYILHIMLIKVIEWIRIDIFNQIFGDLVLKYIPFYYYILNSWALFALIWVGCFIVSNRYFGRD